jgi:hypothetical protein
LQIK